MTAWAALGLGTVLVLAAFQRLGAVLRTIAVVLLFLADAIAATGGTVGRAVVRIFALLALTVPAAGGLPVLLADPRDADGQATRAALKRGAIFVHATVISIRTVLAARACVFALVADAVAANTTTVLRAILGRLPLFAFVVPAARGVPVVHALEVDAVSMAAGAA